MRTIEAWIIAAALALVGLVALTTWRMSAAIRQSERVMRLNRRLIARRQRATGLPPTVVPLHRPAYSVGGVLEASLRESVARQAERFENSN